MFTVRLKCVNKCEQCEKLKKSSVLFRPICISVPYNPFFFLFVFVRHFAAEELRHVCCRISCIPGSPTRLVPAYISFPPGGRCSQAVPPCCADPSPGQCTHSKCRGWENGGFSGDWKLGCGEVKRVSALSQLS